MSYVIGVITRSPTVVLLLNTAMQLMVPVAIVGHQLARSSAVVAGHRHGHAIGVSYACLHAGLGRIAAQDTSRKTIS